jgi:hypothetical protein
MPDDSEHITESALIIVMSILLAPDVGFVPLKITALTPLLHIPGVIPLLVAGS